MDCVAEYARRGTEPKHWRPTDGKARTPRCATHLRQRARRTKDEGHERRVQRVYGLKPGQYGEIYLHQGGKCAICQRATGESRRLSVDHDHGSGFTRGLLCRPCNDVLGLARDDPQFFYRAAAYLMHPPALGLGILAVHEDFRKDED